jgi:PAS domain S-box-containing protein
MMHDNTGSSGLDFLAGGGEAGALMRSMDWSTSPLGSPADWPQSLRSVVSLLLNSKFPMFVAWGPDLGFLYNDNYAEILGAKHPVAMGCRFKDVWSEIWGDIQPSISKAMAGEATFHEDLPLVIQRKGFDEQTYFTFSYSPVRDETGGIGGMFCACTETTKEVETRAALQADREHLHRLFQQAPSMICILSGPEHVFELANPIYLEFIGNRDVIGRKLREAVPELEEQGFPKILDDVYATGKPFVGRQIPVTAQPQDGSPAKTQYFDFVYQPIKDEQGRVTGIFAEGHDVTEQVHAQTSLRESEARLEAVLRQSPVGIVLAEAPSGKIVLRNEQVTRIWGHSSHTASKVEEYRVYRGFDRSTGRQLEPGEWPLARSITTGEVVINEEVDIERSDGSRATVMLNSAPIVDEQGRIVAGVVVFSDITDRAVAERHQRLLINELNHRVKNTLATVQSLAAQSFRDIGEGSRPKLKTFEDRLFALSRVHDVLTRERWDGAELREIIAEVLEPYLRQSGKRFEISGPRLRLTPSMALALAMAVHELATNATKYGSLSTPSGRVLINWKVAEDGPPLLTLTWKEQGGPPVTPPTRKGFGTRLMERMLASELSGEVLLSYDPSGVLCEITAPLQNEELSPESGAVS